MGVAFCERPRRLSDNDDLTTFSSGEDVVDSWVSLHARKADKTGTSAVYVAMSEGSVAGIYTLSAYTVDRASAHGWLSRNAPERIPVILLGILGVDKRFQGRGLGKDLLRDAARRSVSVAREIGARALVVEPANDSVAGFYEGLGFQRIQGTGYWAVKIGR